MAEPKTKKLNIEDKLGGESDKKELQELKDIVKNLPTAAKIRIYKMDEDGGKKFIVSVPASDFDSANAFEYIKSKYSSKYGGGDYVIELLDGEGQTVGRNVISLIGEEPKDTAPAKHIEMMDKALDMKEAATDKLIEANTKMHEVEQAKSQSTMELMSKQWDAMAKIFESRIADLSRQKEATPDPMMQMLIQRDIDNVKRDIERDRDKIMSEIKSKEDSRSGNDKMMELLMTMILNKKEENPIDTISKTMEMVANMSGGQGDTLDDIMSNPVKLKMYKEMMGLDEKKKDFFEDLMSNPMKAEMFKKILGVEEKKKDLLTEVMENPEKFKMVQRMLGLPTAEEFSSRNSVPPIIPEVKKDFLEQM
ncbi:MAG: hypothetical protein Q8K02_00370, partial [Flavobacterium sp.]|nr:hypothetical protein [Flavobacterium sp.]